MATLLEHFRDGLIAAGIPLRIPRDPDPDRHPLWLEPKGGAIGPGDVENEEEDDEVLVASAFQMPGLSTGAWEGDTYRYTNVDLRLRTQKPPRAWEIEKAIRPVLHDRRNFDLGGMRVIEAMIYLEMAPVGAGSETGFTYRVEYSLQHYLSDQPG